MATASEVGRYRTGVANLLSKLVAAVGETERRLDVAIEGDEASARAVLEDDPANAIRIMCALLLRKARLHMVAMLRANETGNVHSLAIQMRPVLECAGQVVLVFHNLIIDPERGVSVVSDYINADYYRTVRRLTMGDLSHKELLTRISEASGMSEEEVGKGRSLKQADKVAPLEGGKDWYGYLSERFCHGRGGLERTFVAGRRQYDEHGSGRVHVRWIDGLLGEPSSSHERARGAVPCDRRGGTRASRIRSG